MAIHAGQEPEPGTGATATPIYQTASFAFRDAKHAEDAFADGRDQYVYTRWGNPTTAAFEQKLAALEGAEAALATASGMAAVSTAVLSQVKHGDHAICARNVYSASFTLFYRRLPTMGVEVSLVDGTDAAAFAAAVRPNTRLIYAETPGNPTLQLTDLTAVGELAHRAGAVLLVDNTFATPLNQRPLAFGATAVLHSTTKYLGGHGDLIGGAIAGSHAFVDSLWSTQIELGGTPSPFNAFLGLRGMQTFPLRMERHNRNAQLVAEALEATPEVAWVAYPGLPSHPQHELAARQMTGFGGMVCFELAGGLDAGRKLIDGVQLCTRAVSLGDVKTLLCHPASSTHFHVPESARREAGITDGLVRLSVGLEDPEDILADLRQALLRRR